MQYDRQESIELFNGTFPNGFAWEVIKVFSPPPKVGFSWRHWGRFSGQRSLLVSINTRLDCYQNDPSSGTFKGNQGDGQTVNVYGFAVATVNEKLQIQTIEIYYDQAEFMNALQQKTAGMILVNHRKCNSSQTLKFF